jgi:hypothetical protein
MTKKEVNFQAEMDSNERIMNAMTFKELVTYRKINYEALKGQFPTTRREEVFFNRWAQSGAIIRLFRKLLTPAQENAVWHETVADIKELIKSKD